MIAALLLAAAMAAGTQPVETVAEIRVHGNATIPDDKIIELAGVSIGDTLQPDSLDGIAKRLRDSGRFDQVEVTKRYRTLEMDQVAIVLLVHERPGVTPSGEPPSVMRRLRNRLMFLPILDYEDGYGWTYGARTSVIGALGAGERISVPLSWGGTRRAAVEVDRTFQSGPLTRVFGTYGISQRENPYFHLDDQRVFVRGRAERRLFKVVRLGAEAAHEDVSFGDAHQPQWAAGADVILDTRRDPAYPVNAVFAGLSWDRLHIADSAIDRYRYTLRGYRRLVWHVVGAARVEFDTASAPLPAHEQWLLGGTFVRGIPAGTTVGDKLLAWTAELRVPISSPLNIGRLGFNAFYDDGAVSAFGIPVRDGNRERGAGGGVFAMLPFINLNLEVAHSLDGRGTRVHFATGFTF